MTTMKPIQSTAAQLIENQDSIDPMNLWMTGRIWAQWLVSTNTTCGHCKKEAAAGGRVAHIERSVKEIDLGRVHVLHRACFDQLSIHDHCVTCPDCKEDVALSFGNFQDDKERVVAIAKKQM